MMARLFGVCQSYHAERLLETRMKRITFLIAVAFGLAISSASFAQTVVDVVYLKNGSVIRNRKKIRLFSERRLTQNVTG